jgi:hypothetical protein
MTIFGRRLSDYAAFCRFFLVLIPVVGITRLLLSLEGVPNSTAKWFSVTALVWIGVLYYSIRVHTRGFGSYKQLLVICVLQNLVAQAVIIFGIVLAMVTGTGNIYSAPEYAFGSDGASWFHLGAHLVIGTTIGSLVPWLFGSLILAATRKFAGPDSNLSPDYKRS